MCTKTYRRKITKKKKNFKPPVFVSFFFPHFRIEYKYGSRKRAESKTVETWKTGSIKSLKPNFTGERTKPTRNAFINPRVIQPFFLYNILLLLYNFQFCNIHLPDMFYRDDHITTDRNYWFQVRWSLSSSSPWPTRPCSPFWPSASNGTTPSASRCAPATCAPKPGRWSYAAWPGYWPPCSLGTYVILFYIILTDVYRLCDR